MWWLCGCCWQKGIWSDDGDTSGGGGGNGYGGFAQMTLFMFGYDF